MNARKEQKKYEEIVRIFLSGVFPKLLKIILKY